MQSQFVLTARTWPSKHYVVLHDNHARALIACLFAARAEGRGSSDLFMAEIEVSRFGDSFVKFQFDAFVQAKTQAINMDRGPRAAGDTGRAAKRVSASHSL
jgi:hypothetical protein